jgi:SOS-response transcriptional repressor LexA
VRQRHGAKLAVENADDVITKQQRKALVFIEAELERTGGIAPSVREIADHFHYRSPTMARHLLQGLEERGFIRRLPGKDRAIEVLKPVSRFATFRFDARTKALKRFW